MAVLVFRLNDAPEEEAQAVRDLLDNNHIDFYETSSGKWGFSVAGIWLKNASDKERARELIDDYQATLSEEVRQQHEEMRASGQLDSVFSRFTHQPLQVLIYIILALLVIYLTVVPFFSI